MADKIVPLNRGVPTIAAPTRARARLFEHPLTAACIAAAMALALAVMFAYFALGFDGRESRKWYVLLPPGVVLSAVANPSVLIAFLPCACAVEVYRGASESWRVATRLFPVAAAIIIWGQRLYSNRLQFAGFLYALGMVISICVMESVPRLRQGNFAGTGQTVTFPLYAESMIALLAVPWRRAWPAWGAFTLHVLFGIVWYSAALFMPFGTFL
jgi:hypothetical protein